MKIIFEERKDYPRIGVKIKDYRQQSDKPLTRLAADAGISVTHWNRIENEKCDVPIETLRAIEKALGVSLI